MKLLKYLSLIIPVTFVLTINPALAEHEADHRYEVMGFILDKDKNSIVNSDVTIQMEKFTIGSGTTNSQGFYKIRLHLHDPDFGKELHIITPAGEGTIKVDFTPGDKLTPREHHANFIGGELVEERLSRHSTPLWIYISGAAILLLAVMTYIMFNNRKSAPGNRKRDRKKHKKR